MVSLKRIVSYVICALFMLCTIGCNSKQTPIDRLKDLTEEIQNGGQDYTEEEWKASEKELELIETEIDQYKSRYTDHELKEIGRLKGICIAQFTKHTIKTFKNDIEDAVKETEGFVEGFVQGFEDEKK